MNTLTKPKAFFAVSLMIFLCSVFSCLLISIIRLPDEIHLLAEQENRLSLGGRFLSATIRPEPAAHAVVSVNSLPNRDIIITPDDSTVMDMQVSLFGLPLKTVSVDIMKDIEVVPCGMTVGVRFNTQGVMVLGIGSVVTKNGDVSRPSEGILKSGDIILEANGKPLQNKEQLMTLAGNLKEGEQVSLKIKRDNATITTNIAPAYSKEENAYKLGVWLRDGTEGIGTLTYYNPASSTFGALGHGILDVDTKKLMAVKSGELLESSITGVRKGKRGSPGELIGEVNRNGVIGTIKLNSTLGLYGSINTKYSLPAEKMGIALQGQVHEGPAVIRSNINGRETKNYDVYIENVNKYSSDESKGMIIRITDQELITGTNGIVQGMSGSPIIQDGKLVGAVTHVFVQNPLKGYGIFIENMLKQEKNM